MGIVDADAEDQTRVWTVIGDVRDDIQSDSKLRTKSVDVMKDFVVVASLVQFLIFGEEGMCPPKRVEMN